MCGQTFSLNELNLVLGKQHRGVVALYFGTLGGAVRLHELSPHQAKVISVFLDLKQFYSLNITLLILHSRDKVIVLPMESRVKLQLKC